MTTPQPAALPELPEPSLQQGKYGYRLSHEDYYTADQMRARDAMWAERLAALQPQPAAAVSDERQLLREIVENHAESLQALGDELRQRGVTQISYYGPQAEVVAKSTQLIDRARALLALRPAHQTTDVQQRLFQLLNGAAGDGLIINDIDAAELFTDLFPEHIEFVTRGGVSPTKPAAQATPGALAGAWDEGYRLGVEDERTSEANIGVAGFGAKVNPARQNPYRAQQATPESLHLFEFWWAAHLPQATQAQAWAAWTAAQSSKGAPIEAPQQATPEPVGEVFYAADGGDDETGAGYYMKPCVHWTGKAPEAGTKLFTRPAPGVPEGVLAILDECRNALMECDRDGDYALIDRIAALAAAQAKGADHAG